MKNLTLLTTLILLIFSTSCKKESSDNFKNITGTYTGLESHSFHPAFPPTTPDTVYNQSYSVSVMNNDTAFAFTSDTPSVYSNSVRAQHEYIVNALAFSSLKYGYTIGGTSAYRNFSLEIREDSLFIDYKDFYWTNVNEWHFAGVKID